MNSAENPIKILIAEDDDAAAHLIKTNLRRSGLQAEYIRARNGEEALLFLHDVSEQAPIRKTDPLVVLLDIRMPKVDGMEVLKAMKSSSKLSKIPVIMLTTSDRPKEVDACYRLGCNLYLKKQVDYAKFTDSIGRLAAFIATCELPLFGDPSDE